MRKYIDPASGKQRSAAAQVWNNIDADVEDGVAKTPNELLARYANNRARVVSHLGWGVNEGRWAIEGVWPNNNSGKKDKALNALLGKEILAIHGNKTISVISDFKRRSIVG